MPTAMDTVLAPGAVHAFACDVLVALGMPDEDAAIIADSMVWAGLHDRLDYSLLSLNQIANRAAGGGLSLVADWTPAGGHGNVTLLEAGRAWGVLAGARGMRHAVAKARSHGVGLTVVRNCDGTGAMSWYTSLAVEENLIGMAITNGAPQLPPWGGTGQVLGDHAFSIAAPAGDRAPLVLDMGLGAAGDGDPPPIGGHRAYGLGLQWEVLTGVLSGGSMLTELHLLDEVDAPAGNSLFLLATDPAASLPYQEFLGRAGQLVDQIHASPSARGFDRVRVPGEQRAQTAQRRATEGIPYPATHMATLRALAERLSVPWPG